MKRFSLFGFLSPFFCGAPAITLLSLTVCLNSSNLLFAQAVPTTRNSAPIPAMPTARPEASLPPEIPRITSVEHSLEANSAASAATEPVLGVNIGWVTDWDPTQMFADAMKQARRFGSTEHPYDEAGAIDALGWAIKDAGVAVIVGNQGVWSAGRYALAFTGQATVESWGDENVIVGTVAYDSATNTSTATVTVRPEYQTVYLVFAKTRRTPASPVGSGVTHIALRRPI